MSEISKYEEQKKKMDGLCEEHDLVYSFRKEEYPITLTLRTVQGTGVQLSMLEETDGEKLEQSRVGELQADYMNRHQSLGARCYVIAGFRSGKVYKIPWDVWDNMKSNFGRKYVTEKDLEKFLISEAWNEALLLI